jgi:SAM-dependent methyltransferase
VYEKIKEVTKEQFDQFAESHNDIIVSGAKITIGQEKKIKQYQPEHFELERTNVWSFPERGTWATHKGDFRGNWPPQMARNIILRYSKTSEIVLDQMCGSGTTLIECKLLGRNGLGVDINRDAVMITRDRIGFEYKPLDSDFPSVAIQTYVGDARKLDLIKDETIDLVATHPPYANIISYSSKNNRVPGDLSFAHSLIGYLEGMKEIAKESYRVLKPGRFCAILIGDTRRHRHHVPISFRVMQDFLEVGFILREDIMKYQWKTKVTRERWAGLSKVAEEQWVDINKQAKKGRYTDFLLLSYEHLFIFRKPEENEDISCLKSSMNF